MSAAESARLSPTAQQTTKVISLTGSSDTTTKVARTKYQAEHRKNAELQENGPGFPTALKQPNQFPPAINHPPFFRGHLSTMPLKLQS
ncbi:hypothetical protein [Sterolibacterium denitrificans]|uniref:hypothetical protein n=1 Tax=Sterolibacterium denitrificans TaxID=157592 RepID=UPI0012B6A6F2|nr:hypothetical protein [Sterolibacterium denitrificans]